MSAVLNTDVVRTFLDQISATIPAGARAVLVWDGAGYHSASTALRCPPNMVLVGLPACAPERNPAERLWLYLREHHWSNRTYEDMDAPEDAPVEGWRAVCLHPEKIKTTCRCEYLTRS